MTRKSVHHFPKALVLVSVALDRSGFLFLFRIFGQKIQSQSSDVINRVCSAHRFSGTCRRRRPDWMYSLRSNVVLSSAEIYTQDLGFLALHRDQASKARSNLTEGCCLREEAT